MTEKKQFLLRVLIGVLIAVIIITLSVLCLIVIPKIIEQWALVAYFKAYCIMWVFTINKIIWVFEHWNNIFIDCDFVFISYFLFCHFYFFTYIIKFIKFMIWGNKKDYNIDGLLFLMFYYVPVGTILFDVFLRILAIVAHFDNLWMPPVQIYFPDSIDLPPVWDILFT